MDAIKRFGSQIELSLSADVPAELVALVATTSHGQRLHALFVEASAHLLEVHREAVRRPSSFQVRSRRDRAKAFLDLIRARRAAVGAKRPSVAKMLTILQDAKPKNVVDIRKAA